MMQADSDFGPLHMFKNEKIVLLKLHYNQHSERSWRWSWGFYWG
jgi:hypothetical protein